MADPPIAAVARVLCQPLINFKAAKRCSQSGTPHRMRTRRCRRSDPITAHDGTEGSNLLSSAGDSVSPVMAVTRMPTGPVARPSRKPADLGCGHRACEAEDAVRGRGLG